MDKKQQQILIYTFAMQFDDEQLKAEFKAGRITQEQYLEITDLKREKTNDEIEGLLDELKADIKLTEENAKQQEQQKREKREAQVEKINESATVAKENLKKNKKKYTKIAAAVAACIIGLLVVVNGIMFVSANYLGFTDVDLGSMVIIDYDTDAYTADPYFKWNGQYYNDSGYYDDFKEELKASGIYNDDEIEALVPKYDADVYTAIQTIYMGYDLSTENDLLNGETIEVTVNYDANLAKQYKVNVVNNKVTFEIKGLREQVSSDEITKQVLDSLGGIDTLENLALEEPYRYDSSDYTSTVKAVKFLFEDAESVPSPSITSDSDNGYSYDTNESYMQYLNIAYYINDAYIDSDGERNSNRDDNYLCSQQFAIYKQDGKVKVGDDDVYTDCTSLYDEENINDAIDDDGSSVGLGDEYTTLEGML